MTPELSIQSRKAWHQTLPLFLAFASLIVVAYFDTASAIVSIWYRSETFTHGFLVVPIVMWLVWRKRPLLAVITPRASAWGVVLLALAALAWLVGELASVNALSQLAFVAMLALLVPALLGIQVARTITFPLAFLFFAVPLGDFAMPQLMEWTADFTVLALRATGVPVYREGLQFVIPSGNWSVVEACSGVRYLIASLTVGTLFAYLSYESPRRRALFMVVSMVVPVLANWVRAYLIVMLGHVSGNKLATGVDHLIYGWAFFGVVIMLMFFIGARWAEPESATPHPKPEAVVAIAPVPNGKLFFFASLVLLLLVWPPLYEYKIKQVEASLPAPQLSPLQLSAQGWDGVQVAPGSWQPAYANPATSVVSQYSGNGSTVNLYVGYYRNQDATRKLVSSSNVLVSSKDPSWAQVASGRRQQQWGNLSLKVRTAELRSAPIGGQLDAERLVVWKWYWINGSLTGSDALAKAYTAFYSLIGRGDDSAVIVVSSPKGDKGQGEQALEAFMLANHGKLLAWLDAAKNAP